MTSTSTHASPVSSSSVAPQYLKHGAVHLDVTDLKASVEFWSGLIGLTVLAQSVDEVSLGVLDDSGHPESELLVLHAGATLRPRRGTTGLYHLAIHLPNETEFARILGRLIAARVPQSPTDHVMSKTTYLSDPDGIGLELTLETWNRVRSFTQDSRGMPHVIDVNGNVSDGRLPLDVDEVLSHFPDDGDLTKPLPSGTKIGHVHLHVKDFPSARPFYTGVLGFQLELDAPTIGMIDFSAGGAFPHVMAMNTWQGVGAGPAPEGTAGLRSFTIRAADQAALEAILKRAHVAGFKVEQTDQGAWTKDPSGHRILLVADGEDAPLPHAGSPA